MAEDLFIPKLGQTVEEVVLINWLVEDGAKVDFGDPVLEVETDKAIFNVEANAKGYLRIGPYQVGETLPVLTVVATIGKKDEGFSPAGQKTDQTESDQPEPVEEPAHETAQVAIEKTSEIIDDEPLREKIFVSPRAKKLALEKNVDLSKVPPTGGEGVRIIEQDVMNYLQPDFKATPIAAEIAREVGLDISTLAGSGPKGVITRGDVESAIRSQLAVPAKAPLAPVASPQINYADLRVSEVKPLASVRKVIFERMAASVHTTARVTMVTEADASNLVAFRERLKAEKAEEYGFAPGYNELLGIIVARTLRAFPYMNARLSADGSQIEYLDEVNLGIAVDTERGLLVPVVKNADQADLKTFGSRFRSLVERALSGRISPDDLMGGTFTITNLGNYDVDAFTPVINLPEVAILGIGRIQDKVVPVQGEPAIRKMITLSLVFDHRIVDGAPAARFLQKVKEVIEYPIMIFV